MNSTKPIFFLALGVFAAAVKAQPAPLVQLSTGLPSVNAMSHDPRAAAENPVAFRAFTEKPTAAVSPVVIDNPDGPKVRPWSVEVQSDMPSNFPLTLDSTKGERSKTFTGTFLSVKQTYRAKFDNYKSQVFDITVPVYYDDRYLQLNAQDQKLLAQLEGELKSVLNDMDALSNRAERLSKDLAALYARGRPTKLLKQYVPVPAYGERESDKSAYQAPLFQVLPTAVK